MTYNKKSIIIVSLLCGFILFLSRCINNQVEPGNDPRGNVYAGAATCRQCHQAIYDSFVSAAHAKATSRPLAENIRGHFSQDNDSFNYTGTTKIVMEKRGNDYYQVIYQNGKENGAYKFDLLFGFKNAQTSAYWANDKFYELPVSHYASVNAWATSPGFPADFVKLGRLINTNCLDCHSSGITIKPGSSIESDGTFEKNTLVYGIDCERCHGPALNHVNYHLVNPGLKTAAYIVRNSMLTRQQKLDGCAICHSGNDKEKIQSRFRFKIGDTLDYFFVNRPAQENKEIDVHGNQFSLLQQSKCFRNTNNMTCATCHDPHNNDSRDLAMYSQKCMSCHKQETNNFCPEIITIGESIKQNCIDCHMPKRASVAISFQLPGSKLQSSYLLRTHRIAVYEDSTQNVHGKGIKIKN